MDKELIIGRWTAKLIDMRSHLENLRKYKRKSQENRRDGLSRKISTVECIIREIERL